MPVIMVNTLGLLEEQKERIARKYTAILSQETNVPPDRIYVFFGGFPLESIAAGGVLNSELPQSVIDTFVTKYSSNVSGKVTVVTRMKAKEGLEDAAKQALVTLITATRKEPGTLRYDLYQQNYDDLGYFVLYEEWKGQEAIDAHMATEHFKAFVAKAPELLQVAAGAESPFEVMVGVPFNPAGPLPSPARIVIRMKAQEGALDSAKQALITMMSKTRNDPGVISYDPYQEVTDPSLFMAYQIFKDPQSIVAHRQTPHFKVLDGRKDALFAPCEGPNSPFEILLLTPYVPQAKKVSVRENAVLGDEELMTALRRMNPAFGELCIETSGKAYGTPLIDQKTKVLIAIAVDVVEQITGKPFENHIRMAVQQGITRDELEELLLFMTIYAGFNKVGIFYSALNQAMGVRG